MRTLARWQIFILLASVPAISHSGSLPDDWRKGFDRFFWIGTETEANVDDISLLREKNSGIGNPHRKYLYNKETKDRDLAIERELKISQNRKKVHSMTLKSSISGASENYAR